MWGKQSHLDGEILDEYCLQYNRVRSAKYTEAHKTPFHLPAFIFYSAKTILQFVNDTNSITRINQTTIIHYRPTKEMPQQFIKK